jgi:NADPH2:quinone reductase
MKAAVINAFGDTPRYSEFPDPVPVDGEQLITVKACALENFDKGTAAGLHYSSKKLFPQFPAIVGNDGVGRTKEGRLVWFGQMRPPYGAFASTVAAGYTLPVPDGIDPAEAAAIPPSTLTCLLPLKYSAKLQPGETVLVNGATGVTGRIAVQVAKLLGAGKVIATGRNERSLELLQQLGADSVIDLKQPEEPLAGAFAAAAGGVDIVIDFLWGRPAELLLNAFIPQEAGFARRRTRYIQAGERAGSQVSLRGSMLRTSGLELMGIGKLSFDVVQEEMTHVWDWMAAGKLCMEIERVPLADIAEAWVRDDLEGKRLVIVP